MYSKAKGKEQVATYFFTHNLQGDIVGVYDAKTSKLVGTYSYDAWGKPLDEAGTKAQATSDPNNILVKNPFRYRGYYYDKETGFYYLETRYYDPNVKRMISSDTDEVVYSDLSAIHNKNLYVFCDNNPVTRIDPNGDTWQINDKYGLWDDVPTILTILLALFIGGSSAAECAACGGVVALAGAIGIELLPAIIIGVIAIAVVVGVVELISQMSGNVGTGWY